MKLGISFSACAVLACLSAPAAAQMGVSSTVTASNNSYSGSLSVLNDGIYPANGTNYQTSSVHDFNRNATFTFTFGGLTSIGSFKSTVDNNDDYTFTFFNDTAGTSLSKTILVTDGSVNGGFETFTSDAALGGTFLSSLALASPVLANRVVISTAPGDGDRLYGIAEAQFFASTAAVPEPATWGLMLAGFGAVGFAMRRRYKGSARVTFA